MPKMIIAFIFLSSIALGEVPSDQALLCPPDKDKLIQQCYLDTCVTKSTETRVSLDSDAFYRDLEKYQYIFPENDLKGLKAFEIQIETISKNKKKFIAKQGFDNIAGDILSDVLKNREAIGHLFSDKFTYTFDQGSAKIMLSDLEVENRELYKRIGSFYKELVEYDFNYDYQEARALYPESNKFYAQIANEMAVYFDDLKDPRAENLKKLSIEISNSSKVFKNWFALNSLFSKNDYAKMLTKKFSGIRKDLSYALKLSEEEDSDDKDQNSNVKEFENVSFKMCKIASFMSDKFKDKDLLKEFSEMKAKVLAGLEEKFLANICPEMAASLRFKLKEDIFKTIELNKSIYPDYNKIIKDNAPYTNIQDTKTYLEAVTNQRKTDESSYTCSMSLIFPDDNFDPNDDKIHISSYSIGLGYPDIVAHELGHWISTKIRNADISPICKEKFLKLRKCISSFYTNDDQDKYLFFTDDKLKTEEDFADWFAATIYPVKSNFYCDEIKSEPLLLNYLSQVNDTKSENIYLPSSDTHSADLFRELHLRLVMGIPLSQSCQELIEQTPEAHPKKCEL